MELLQLRYFQTVAKMESISNAAEYYNIPQPAMSQTIARLEESLGGVKLFDRRNGRLFLNDEGKIFLDYVDKALYELDCGINALENKNDTEVKGSIRIKIMDCHRLVLTCIPQFTKMHEGVSFSISHGYYEDQDVSYDICVSSSSSYKHMTWHVPLLKERLILAVHEDHPLAKEKSIKIADLKHERMISLPPQSTLYAIISDACRSAGFTPEIPIVCDDPYFVRKYVSDNMGVALAPELSWKGRFRENTALVQVEDSPLMTSYLIMDGKKYPTRAVSSFTDYLIEEAKKVEGNLV